MRDSLSIIGGVSLNGTVRVSGAKNSALPLIISTLLSSEECRIDNVPDLEDISVLIRLLRSLGSEVAFSNHTLTVRTPEITQREAPYALVKALRASFWVLGPILSRCSSARVALPGGDAIGTRPVDLHLKGLSRLGADIRMRHGVVIAAAPGGLRGAEIALEYQSVGATHQLLMAAALARGETVLRGAAQEPEVVELCEFLRGMGAQIEGEGTKEIRIIGQRELGGARISCMGDRIEAITYLAAGAVTGGSVTVTGISAAALEEPLNVLARAGAQVVVTPEGISVYADSLLSAVSIETSPFPGLATDVQPILMAVLTKARGESEVVETVFENRFGHVAEYRRFGADIRVEGRTAFVTGVKLLSAAPVEAMDIRAAAGLVLMGLMAEGITEVTEVHHLDRGYDGLVRKLRQLGASIARTPIRGEQEVVCGC